MRAAGSAMRNVVSNGARSQGFWLQVRASIQPPGSLNEDAGAHQSHVAQAAQGHGDVKLLPNDIEALRDRRKLGLSARHEQCLRKNNRAKNSHQAVRRREWKMQRFKSPWISSAF